MNNTFYTPTRLFFSKTQLLIFLFFTSLFSFGQEFKNLALHSNVTHVQPLNGIVFWADNLTALNNLGDKCQLEFSYITYSDVVSEEGVYDWSVVDNMLQRIADHQRQAVLRFRFTYPGVTTPSVPACIRNSSGYTNQIMQVEGRSTYIPDWSNSKLKEFTLDFYTEFAERYDNDPRLAYLQVGFGSYSEYHLYDGPLNLGQTFPSMAFQSNFLEHLDTSFNETSWSVSIDAASGDYTPISENSYLRSLNYGLFDDSFLHQNHSVSSSEYNRSSWLFFGEERTDTRVAGGEFNYYSAYDQENVLNLPDGPWGVSFEELAEEYHISYIIGNDQYNYQPASRIEQASMNIGYNYEVNEFRTNNLITQVSIKNTGIAPIYYDAYPAVSGVRSSESLKGLAAGENRIFTINGPASDETLTIESDRLVAGQEIQFNASLEADVLSTPGITVDKELVSSYPNPFGDKLIINNKTENPIGVLMYDLTGRKVQDLTISNSLYEMNTSELQSGVYFIKVAENNILKNLGFFVKK